jgi:hypothetical protein
MVTSHTQTSGNHAIGETGLNGRAIVSVSWRNIVGTPTVEMRSSFSTQTADGAAIRTASAVNSRTVFQFLSAISLRSTIHDPPMAATMGSAR